MSFAEKIMKYYINARYCINVDWGQARLTNEKFGIYCLNNPIKA